MPALPTGTVTFLFTDIEASTRLLQKLGDAVSKQAFTDHRRLLIEAVEATGGGVYQDQGESFVFIFSRAKDAVLGAIAGQRALRNHAWPDGGHLRVRMGLHSGEPVASDEEYVGLDVHRAARICSAGHGGQILLSLTTRELVADTLPQGVGLRDLGQHRLKDLTRPQQLFQVVVPDLPSDFPPLKSLDILPNNLPVHLTSFVGRDHEKAEVIRLLSTTRLLTLTGSGGAGKTRLALQIAAEVLEEFKDGVWAVELASVSNPALVAKAVASAMNIPEQLDRPLSKTLEDSLRSKSLLLLLDNCEHLVSACADLGEALLRVCPDLRVLATSRESLGLEGETTYRVPSLSLPDAPSLPFERITEFEAIRLFVDRATAALPSFAVTIQNAKAVATICQQLDGIPLAIELAAPKVKSLSVEHIAERLHDRFGLLTTGRRTALPRQQTLRATMDWSYDLLSEPERVLLRRLSVFAGGFTLEGAEAVCQGQGVRAAEVIDLLTRLVEKSLVVFQEGEQRYRLLETVRQYGREKLLESGEEAATRGRHRDWYLALAEQADPKLRGPEQQSWLDRLEVEHDNLRAALEWSKRPSQAGEGLRLAIALLWFWQFHGHWSEGRRWLEAAASLGGETASRIPAKALRYAAFLAFEQGDYARAASLAQQGVTLSRESGDDESLVYCGSVLGLVALHLGDYRQAATQFADNLSLCRKLGDEWLLGRSLSHMGFLVRDQGDYLRAAGLHSEALAHFRKAGDKHYTAWALLNLGTVALRQNDHKQAAALCRESIMLSREIGGVWHVEQALAGLAGAAALKGQYERAAQVFATAEALRTSLGRHRSITDQADFDKRVASASAGLGEAAFAAAWTEGGAMTLEQAIEYALRE